MAHRFTHVAVATARMAVANALHDARQPPDGLVIPWCTYTDPETAHVGLYVREAMRDGIAVSPRPSTLHAVAPRAPDGPSAGFLQPPGPPGTHPILGPTTSHPTNAR